MTSIFLSYTQWHTEENKAIDFEFVVPHHEGVQTIDYRVVGDTAKAGEDFVASSGTFVFRPNESSRRFSVQLLDDRLFEDNEHFYIELSNPVPTQPYRQTNYVSIRDDEQGYAPGFGRAALESAGHIEIPIYRRGDIDFTSSVEVFLEGGTAEAGIDYVDGNHIVEFGPNETVKTIHVPLINNTVEDAHSSLFLRRGDRIFYVGVRNGTGGIPIAYPDRADVIIHDNELGYALRPRTGSADLGIYEGGPEPLVLERLGDYDVASVATVTVTSPAYHYPFPPAEAGVDYTGAEFQIQFAPGQSSAEVPLVIINDALPESREWLTVQYPTNLSIAGSIEQKVAILDNEFNPLPVTPFCLNLQRLVISVTPLRDGKFLVAAADDDSASNLTIRRFTASGEPDPTFQTIMPVDPPIKIVEGADGKYTISFYNWRTGKQGVERHLADGRPDPSFQRLVEQYVNGFGEFEVTADGKLYLGYPLRRLNSDGTLDASFAPPLQSLDDLILDAEENIYLRGANSWVRITPAGVVDSAFSEVASSDTLRDVGAVLYNYRYDSQQMLAKTWRILASGAPDPNFTPITNGWVYAGEEGKLYAFDQVGSETHIRRHHSDGALDTNYTRGTLDVDWLVFDYSMLPNGRGFMTRNVMGARSLNGAEMYCADGSQAVARVDLEIPTQRTIVEPGQTQLRENALTANTIPVIRSGDNSVAATIGYRFRSGTAVPGEHYVADATGKLQFAPGMSRILIPITIPANHKPQVDRTVFLDLLDQTGAVRSTTEITIQNDDVGFEVLGRQGKTLRLRAIGGEFPTVAIWQTFDLQTWELASTSYASNGDIIEVEMNSPDAYFRAEGL